MARNKNKLIILSIVLIAVAILAVDYFGVAKIGIFGASGISGYEGNLMTLSIDKVDRVITNNEDLAKANFIITTVGTTSSEEVVGTLSPEDIENSQFGSYKATYPLEITASVTDEKVRYPIVKDQEKVYYFIEKITPSEGHNLFWSCEKEFGECTQTGCVNKVATFGAAENTGIFTNKMHCYYLMEAYKGKLESGSVKWQTTITAKVGSDVATATLNQDSPEASLRDSVGQIVGTVQSPGLIVTGNAPPNSAYYKPVYVPGKNTWNIASYDTYVDCTSKMDTLKTYTQKTGGWFPAWDYYKTGEWNSFNNVMSSAITSCSKLTTENVQITSGTTGQVIPTTVDSPSLDGAGVYADLDYKITKPVFRILIKADWLGLYITTGKPEIVGEKCNDITSGDSGTAYVDVKNSGETQGTFRANFFGCENILKQTYTIKPITLSSGNTGRITLPIDMGKISEKGSASCKIKVCDITGVACDETSVTCKYDTADWCTIGAQILGSKPMCIDECKSVFGAPEGKGKYAEKFCCEDKAPLMKPDGKYYCPSGEDNGGKGGNADWIFIAIMLLFAAIAFIIGYKIQQGGWSGVIIGIILAVVVIILLSVFKTNITGALSGLGV